VAGGDSEGRKPLSEKEKLRPGGRENDGLAGWGWLADLRFGEFARANV